MPTFPLNVEPGDVISSELMTLILTRLTDLSDIVLTGTQLVPDVIGTNLIGARGVIEQQATQLSLGFVVNINGAAINPNESVNANLIVLNQSPTAGNLVAINAPINLVVSQTSGSEPNPGIQPTISDTQTLAGDSETDFPVGETLVIVGSNFSTNVAQNTLTFDGTPAIVSSDPADPTRRLFTTVPTGIPGAPVNPGDDTRENVSVVVRNAISNLSATTQINVTVPIVEAPTIASVSPVTQFEEQNITITGTNYVNESRVLIRDVEAAIVGSPTETEIVATVPQFGDIPRNSLVTASVVVTIPGVGSVPFSGTFRVRGI